MSLEQQLVNQLLRDEGLSLKPYRDSMGLLTIGVGRNLDDRGITKAEALALLDNDIRDFTRELSTRFHWFSNIDVVRRGALINLAFNLGMGGLLTFKKFLEAMAKRNWTEAAKELLDSKYATQVGARAQRLAEQIESGEWK